MPFPSFKCQPPVPSVCLQLFLSHYVQEIAYDIYTCYLPESWYLWSRTYQAKHVGTFCDLSPEAHLFPPLTSLPKTPSPFTWIIIIFLSGAQFLFFSSHRLFFFFLITEVRVTPFKSCQLIILQCLPIFLRVRANIYNLATKTHTIWLPVAAVISSPATAPMLSSLQAVTMITPLFFKHPWLTAPLETVCLFFLAHKIFVPKIFAWHTSPSNIWLT